MNEIPTVLQKDERLRYAMQQQLQHNASSTIPQAAIQPIEQTIVPQAPSKKKYLLASIPALCLVVLGGITVINSQVGIKGASVGKPTSTTTATITPIRR